MPPPWPQFIEHARVLHCDRAHSIVAHCGPALVHLFYRLLTYKAPSRPCKEHAFIFLFGQISADVLVWFDLFLFFFNLALCRTHLSWSVCPCPSPRERTWHVSVLVKTTVERRATSPCKQPVHRRPPAALVTHRGTGQWTRHEDTHERDSGRPLGHPNFDFFHWDSVLLRSSVGTFKQRLGRKSNDGKPEKKGPL